MVQDRHGLVRNDLPDSLTPLSPFSKSKAFAQFVQPSEEDFCLYGALWPPFDHVGSVLRIELVIAIGLRICNQYLIAGMIAVLT